jgi:hypothetical protein
MLLNRFLLNLMFGFHSSIIGEPGIAHIHYEPQLFTALFRRNPKPNSGNTGRDAIEHKTNDQQTDNNVIMTTS